MYIDLDKKYLEKHMKEMNKKAIEEFGEEDGKDNLLNQDCKCKTEYEFNDGKILFNLDTDVGFISFEYTLTDDQMMDIVRHMQDKANKIKEIIKLAE